MVALTFPTGKSAGSPPSIEGLAATQRDLMTIEQLRACGLTDSAVARRVARGTLQRRFRGIYSLGAAPLSREAQWLAAVLAAGPGSALSHLSLAELHGIARSSPCLIAVVSPRVRALRGVKVHRYRRLDPRDVTTERGIPVTTIHRMFVEPAIRDSMARANGRHNFDVLEAALALIRSGSAGYRSRAERTFANIPGLGDPSNNTHAAGVEVEGEPDRVRARLSARRPRPSSSCASPGA